VKEQQSRRWAIGRVASYFFKNFFNPTRERHSVSVMYRALKNEAATISRLNLSEIFPGIDQVEVRVRYTQSSGGGTLSDMITLTQVVAFLGCRCMFEFGTFRGFTTFHLALNSHPEARVYTLDLPASQASEAKLELTDLNLIQKPLSGEWFKNTECESKITQLYGDSANFNFSEYAEVVDFVFIDGAHSYEYVLSDSLSARRLLRPTGIIMWHDYPTYPGVWACLEELSKKWSGKFTWIEGTALVVWQPS
jgi:predicted O-methyltransferase YrrM